MAELNVFTWNGEAISEKMRAAVRFGMDSVMSDCVNTARNTVRKRTTVLQGSIQMRPAVDDGSVITGYWGSFAVNYALGIEEGNPPHLMGPIYPRNKKALFWPGASHPVRSVGIFTHPGNPPYPFLVPAADMHYPSLALRIQAQFAWGQ